MAALKKIHATDLATELSAAYKSLAQVLRTGDDKAIEAVHATICGKIGWAPGAGDERAFLEAYYAQLRARLEGDMRFGKRKADKFS